MSKKLSSQDGSFFADFFDSLRILTSRPTKREGVMGKRWWIILLPALCALVVWPARGQFTAEAIAGWTPGQSWLAAALLLGLYALKGLSMVIPLSALTAAGGLLFPYPAALAVNLTGVAAVQAIPYLLGRRGGMPERLRVRLEGMVSAVRTEQTGRTVFLLRLAGALPGDLVSMFLGAAGVPGRAYFLPGLLGSLPRVACATTLGAALWDIGGRRFWLSLAAGAAMTAAAAVIWRTSLKRK